MAYKEVLFLTDAQGIKTHAVIPIEVYNQLLSLKGLIKDTVPLGTHEMYTFSVKGAIASGFPEGSRRKPHFVVVAGSYAALRPSQSTPAHIQDFREKLLADGTLKLNPEKNCFEFTKDIQFKSPSMAATIVAGNVRNGLDVWLNREGFSLKSSGYGIKKKKGS